MPSNVVLTMHPNTRDIWKEVVPGVPLNVGVPGRLLGWMSRFGERLDLPKSGDGACVCPHSGERYVLRAGRVHVESAA